MGQTLSEPVTAKDTTCVRNSIYRVGSSCMQGWRINMEDSHTHILSLPDDPGVAFFGVYDGHGGAKIADFAGKHLHKYVINRDEYREGNISEALKKAFLELDDTMLEDEALRIEQSGSTAVTIMIKDKMLYCANIGDSRAIASVNHNLEKLSWDHKPNNVEEYERITDAGGWVDCNRVNGNLALSRAFGDYIFKKNSNRPAEEQIVTAYPDVVEKSLTPEWDFLVLACDGIWDVMSDEDVLNYVTENIANGMEPEEICETLMMRCLAPDCQMAGLGCDNMTVVSVVVHDLPQEKKFLRKVGACLIIILSALGMVAGQAAHRVIVVLLHNGTYDDVIEKCKNYISDKSIERDEEEIQVNDLSSPPPHTAVQFANASCDQENAAEPQQPAKCQSKQCPSNTQHE